MKYELVKQLKEAGYITKNYTCSEPLTSHSGICSKCEGDYLSITLSELIEACGDRFGALFRFPGGDMSFPYWVAGYSRTTQSTTAESPEEAVALLWLELNKK